MSRAVAVALCLALFAAPVPAGPPDDVLRMVPADSTLCVLVRDLRGHSARVLESPFADWFPKSALGKAVLAHDGLKKLRETEKTISEHLGLTAQDIRDDILGDAVAFAYTAGQGGKADAEVGVLIGKARKPDTLAKLIRNLNDVQTKAGELKQVRERTHLGLTYQEREKVNGSKEFYFTRDDGLFAYSAQESGIRSVLFMDGRVKERDGVPNPLFLTVHNRLGVDAAAAVLLFNPRTFDAELAAKAKASADPNEKSFLTQFGKLWAATDAVGVSLALDRDAELAVNLAFDKAKVPAELRPLLEADGGSTALWSVVPKDALVAVAGRFDLAKSAQAFQSFLSDDSKDGLKKLTAEGVAPVIGKDTLPKLLTNLGPDWGLWVTPPVSGDKSHLPVATFALRVRAAGSTDTSVGDAILSGLDFVSQLFRVEYNKGHDDQFTLGDEKHDGGTVKFLKNDKALPTGVRPAYGLRGDFLVLASHPDAVKRFTPPAADAKVTNAPLVRVSGKAITGYLKAHRTGLSEPLGNWAGEKPAAIEQKLTEFTTVLELFDRVELHHSSDAGRTKLALRVTPTEPLKK